MIFWIIIINKQKIKLARKTLINFDLQRCENTFVSFLFVSKKFNLRLIVSNIE